MKLKFLIKYLYLTVISISFISCNNDGRIAVNAEAAFYKNGNIKYLKVRNSDNGKEMFFCFDEIGRIDSIRNKYNKIIEGQNFWFYKNGNINSSAIFSNGKFDGASFGFYEDGAIKNHRFWRNGKREGYTTDFFQDSIGTLKTIYFYEHDTVTWSNRSSGNDAGIKVIPTKK